MSRERALEIMRAARWGALATLDGDQPRVRPMAFVVFDDFKLWSSTYNISGKIAQMQAGAKVEVSFVDAARNHVRVEGVIDISGDATKKDRLLELNPKVKRHFSGGDDPKFVHLEIIPTRVRYTPPGFSEYIEVDL